MKPVIFGLSGLKLTDDETRFFRDCNPAGYIVFKRNIESRAQVRELTDSLRAIHNREDLPILIDQEGGRVSRMQPPVWPAFPAAGAFNALYNVSPISAIEAARVNAHAIALILGEVGITVNCMPVMDVLTVDTHPAIGDRSFGTDPVRVAALGQAVLDGLRQGGVVGILKHMPGQGRAIVDSHHDLPVIDDNDQELETDISPFRMLQNAPIAMTGHTIFSAWDNDHCATMSSIIIGDIIRRRIGFDGLLLSDDLEMKALSGSVADRAYQCISAGCDIALYCSARLDEMREIADKLPDISDTAYVRLRRAMSPITRDRGNIDVSRIAALTAKRDELLAFAL